MSGQQGREVVIVEAVRTPVGRGHLEKGYYKDTHPADLLGKTYTEVLDRAAARYAESFMHPCHRSWLTGQSMAGNLRDGGSRCAMRKAFPSNEWSAGS